MKVSRRSFQRVPALNICVLQQPDVLYLSHSYRSFAQLKKTRKTMSAEDVRKAQMKKDSSGLLELAIKAEEQFYESEGGLDIDAIQRESKQMEEEMAAESREDVDDAEHQDASQITSSYIPMSATYSSTLDYDVHAAWYSKKETMTLDNIFYVYQKADGTKVHIREGPNARCNAMIQDLTARQILTILKKPNLFKLFPEELLDRTYRELMDVTYQLFDERKFQEGQRMQYARRLLQHWWLNIKGKPPLKVESSIFI
eukprot:CAMPEP_0202696018 /NCGR_PEP_ID=MMETSP1385-20130828/9410_1 /ASSEMBLY_ACC=CAM_ASM_000861 /TAXON_ID=933848 /ORGANISM="Elphidium margaritaceum" /LENGTH=255 /DNA_ID=CAMNT_0049352113 /DNA_START=40 /DNA_END=807 /DNA_ORIENTATION=+